MTGHGQIELEILREKASALHRVGDRLQRLITRLQAGGLSTADYECVRREAERYRWYLMVQREAIGLVRHDDVMAVYPIPGVAREEA